jgi:hypothetical protein
MKCISVSSHAVHIENCLYMYTANVEGKCDCVNTVWLHDCRAWLQGLHVEPRCGNVRDHSRNTFLVLLWFFPSFHDTCSYIGIDLDGHVNAIISWCVICGWQLCCVAWVGRCRCYTSLPLRGSEVIALCGSEVCTLTLLL